MLEVHDSKLTCQRRESPTRKQTAFSVALCEGHMLRNTSADELRQHLVCCDLKPVTSLVPVGVCKRWCTPPVEKVVAAQGSRLRTQQGNRANFHPFPWSPCRKWRDDRWSILYSLLRASPGVALCMRATCTFCFANALARRLRCRLVWGPSGDWLKIPACR